MRRWILFVLALVLAAAALWLFARRDALRLQWSCYEVTSAADYPAFQERILSFEQEPHDYQRLQALVSRWHTGKESFDDFLVRYLFDPQCTEALREVFSRELSWRNGLLDAWAEKWRAQKPDTKEQIASIHRYLDALQSAKPPRSVTWRDVLDIQAAMVCSGQAALAHRLTPDNWRGRYERWQAVEK